MANQTQSQSSSGTATPAISQQPTLVVTGGSPTPGDAFSNALNIFRNKLTGQQLTDFKNTTYDSLCNDMTAMQDGQNKRKEMMDMCRIQSFLEAMNQFGKVIEIFLNVSEAVAFIWGPIKFLLLVMLPLRYRPSPMLTHVDRKHIF
jgi:hypothetical protein